MATTQIATSVSIISSLLGFQAVSLSAMETTSAPSIMAGSKLEVAGAFFTWGTDETPNASSWTALSAQTHVYLACTPSGSAGNQILTASWDGTAPTWSTSKQGWYSSTGSNIRIIASTYKESATEYKNKALLIHHGGAFYEYRNSVQTTIGTSSGTWYSVASILLPQGVWDINYAITLFTTHGSSTVQTISQDSSLALTSATKASAQNVQDSGYANAQILSTHIWRGRLSFPSAQTVYLNAMGTSAPNFIAIKTAGSDSETVIQAIQVAE